MNHKLRANVLVLFALLGVIAACSKEPAAWSMAEADASQQAFETYLQQYPDGRHAGDARAKLTKMAADSRWDALQAEPSIESLQAFIAAFPDDARNGEARNELVALEAKREWLAAIEQPSSAVFEEFLANYPDGPNVAEAQFFAKLHKRLESRKSRDLRAVPATILRTEPGSDGISFKLDSKFSTPGFAIDAIGVRGASSSLVYRDDDRKNGQRITLYMGLMPQKIGNQTMNMWSPIGFRALNEGED